MILNQRIAPPISSDIVVLLTYNGAVLINQFMLAPNQGHLTGHGGLNVENHRYMRGSDARLLSCCQWCDR
jgi:hypothetical protein